MAKLDIGIDLGTASLIIYMKNKGVVLNEPSVIAINTNTGKIIATGREAYEILGKTPSYIKSIQPLKDGVISDYESAQKMIRYSIEKVTKNRVLRPRIAICIPTNATEVEAMAVVDAARYAGARKVYLIEEPLAAAIGCGIDVSKPCGNLIVDIGGGTADIAVISLNSRVISKSIRLGGDALTMKIKKYVQKNFSVLLGDKIAEKLKIEAATADPEAAQEVFTAKGRNLLTGLPQTIEITNHDLLAVVDGYAEQLNVAIRTVLESTPPELTGDIYTNGAILTGGGALLSGLAGYLEKRLTFPVTVAENPIECVATGTGNSFAFHGALREGFFTPSSYTQKSY